jgi:2,4'-dihydroxyacetophenone dioxygenase
VVDNTDIRTLNIADSPLPALEGVSLTPLFLDRENGVWVMYGRFAPGTVLPTHFHTGSVHFFTTKGRWAYSDIRTIRK